MGISRGPVMIEPILWKNNCLNILDQTILPLEENYIEVTNSDGVINVIKEMNVRGAPSIGYTAIFGVAFIVKDFEETDWDKQAALLIDARPTAVNLAYEVERAFKYVEEIKGSMDKFSLFEKVIEFAVTSMKEAHEKNLEMAHWGEVALKKYVKKAKFNLQTHCNTGTLACATLGTALGIIEELIKKGEVEKVWVDETRPYLQGSRLTAYELEKMNARYDIVVEGAASFLMSRGYVDAIFVGADRIAANGDTANKIGTYNLAIIAKNFNIPFFVAAPLSSFDFSIKSGRDIEVEMRSETEITNYKDHRIAPFNALAFNPSFDITPADFITAIISEKGIVESPNIKKMKWLIEDRLEEA